jgi:Tol biopolymer transport system component
LPVEFENLINEMLEKDRDLRCQSAADIRADLKRLQRKSSSSYVVGASSGVIAAGSKSDAEAARTNVSRGRFHWLTLAVAAVVILAITGFAAWRVWPKPQLFDKISVSQITNVGTIERLALSADGHFLAEVKNDRGQRTLWLRDTATNTDTQIQSAFANEYVGLTFSPDADANYLYLVRGTPEDASERALYVMPVFGGTPKQLIADIDSTVSFSPDGNRFTYIKWTPGKKDSYSEIHVADKDGNNNSVVYTTAEQLGPPVWSPDGNQLAWIGRTSGSVR